MAAAAALSIASNRVELSFGKKAGFRITIKDNAVVSSFICKYYLYIGPRYQKDFL